MKVQNEVLYVYDKDELKAKQDAAEANYRKRLNGPDHETNPMARGGVQLFHVNDRLQFLELYTDLLARGYTRLKDFDFHLAADRAALYTLHMVRPEKDVKPEIKAIRELVEVEYKADIDKKNEELIKDQAQKMFETARRKQAEDKARAEQEEFQRYLAEVRAALEVSADAGVDAA